MKLFIVLSAIVACVLANGYSSGGYESNSYAAPNTYAAPIVTKVVNVNNGQSWQYRRQDGWGNYAFGYDEQHNDAWGSGGSSRDETGDAWNNVKGSYSLNVGDGRKRTVKYVADGAGFRASIKTNEPGIVASAPASVSISSPNGYGHEASYGGPVSHQAYAPAPVVTHVAGYTTENAYGGSSSGGY